MNDRIVVNFGGGVQSTALAYLAINRDPDFIKACGGLPLRWIFADTGDEPAEVYEHVERMGEELAAAGFEFVTVRHPSGSLSDHCTGDLEKGISSPPFFVQRTGRGDSAPVVRGCTRDFKIRPINRQLSRWFGSRISEEVVSVFGISADESQRMRDSPRKGLRNCYPLVSMGWQRWMCHEYLAEQGTSAPRSACVFCPFHTNEEWRRIRRNATEWSTVVEFERRVRDKWRNGAGFYMETEPFLHRSRVPIGEVDFDRQLSLWSMDDECAGVCGV